MAMSRTTRLALKGALIGVAALLLSGCYYYPPPGYGYAYAPGYYYGAPVGVVVGGGPGRWR